MNLKKKVTKGLLVVTAVASISVGTNIVGAQEAGGGEWTYGSNNNPFSLGAFSNYWHPYKFHTSSVVSRGNSNADKKSAGANQTSRAFINTSVGEEVRFHYGFS